MNLSAGLITDNKMIDYKMSELILNHLNYTLDDLSIYIGIPAENGEISHQLYYASSYSSCNLIGYVYHDNGLYYTAIGCDNYDNPDRAALDLISKQSVSIALAAIAQHQITTGDYI